jgi:hypothetical protein
VPLNLEIGVVHSEQDIVARSSEVIVEADNLATSGQQLFA